MSILDDIEREADAILALAENDSVSDKDRRNIRRSARKIGKAVKKLREQPDPAPVPAPEPSPEPVPEPPAPETPLDLAKRLVELLTPPEAPSEEPPEPEPVPLPVDPLQAAVTSIFGGQPGIQIAIKVGRHSRYPNIPDGFIIDGQDVMRLGWGLTVPKAYQEYKAAGGPKLGPEGELSDEDYVAASFFCAPGRSRAGTPRYGSRATALSATTTGKRPAVRRWVRFRRLPRPWANSGRCWGTSSSRLPST